MRPDMARTSVEPRSTIVAVCGSAASGAVPLARSLVGTPGLFLVGDVRKMWSRGARENRLCACGRPFLECSFWKEVGDEAFGGWSRLDADRLDTLSAKIHSSGSSVRLLSRIQEQAFVEYGNYVNRLVDSVVALTGARSIVCYAKNAFEGFVLGRLADAPVRWVHVVRDPREVAWLWTIGTVEMKPNQWLPRTTAGIVRGWCRYNLIPPVLSRLGEIAYMRVRFEDFARDPQRTIARVQGFVRPGERPSAASIEDHSLIVLDRVTGPCRLVELEHREQNGSAGWFPADRRWQQELPPTARAAISLATFPMRAAFGYLAPLGLTRPA